MKDNSISVTTECVISDAAEVWLWDDLIISSCSCLGTRILSYGQSIYWQNSKKPHRPESELEMSVRTHEAPRPWSIHSHTCAHILLSTNIYFLEMVLTSTPSAQIMDMKCHFPGSQDSLEKDSKCGTRTHKISLRHFDTPGRKDAIKDY